MLYSQEFFRQVQSKLNPGGFFIEWNVGSGTQKTMLSVFPHVTSIGIGKNLWILIGSDRPGEFERKKLLTKLDSPKVVNFLQEKLGIDVATIRNDVKAAKVQMYSQSSQAKNGQPQQVNTDLFPRGEYYLNR